MSEIPMAPDWQVSQWINTLTPLKLTQLRGRVVLLHAFQMLCPGCVSHSVPQAEQVHREYTSDGVSVIGLHTVFEHHAAMTPVSLEAFLHEYRITHPVGVDHAITDEPIPDTMRRYKMRGTPSLMLIDRAGRLRLHEFGRMNDLHLGMAIGRLLMEDSPTPAELQQNAGQNSNDTGCGEHGCVIQRKPDARMA